MNGLAIRQISNPNDQRTTNVPLISTLSVLPRQTISGNLGLIPGSRAGVSATVGTVGLTTPTQPNSIEGASLNVLRRGTEFVADSIVAALGGIASLINILQNYSQTGQLQLSGLGSSAQALTSRLLNMGVSAASTIMQQLGEEISPSSVSFRPAEGQLFLSGNAPLTQATSRQINFGESQFEGSPDFGAENLTGMASQNVESAASQLQSGIGALRRTSSRFGNFGNSFDFGTDSLTDAANDGVRLATSQVQSGIGAAGRATPHFGGFERASDFGADNLTGAINQGADLATTQWQSGIGTTERLNAAASNLIQSFLAPFGFTSADGIGPDLNDGQLESSSESLQTAAAQRNNRTPPITPETSNSNEA